MTDCYQVIKTQKAIKHTLTERWYQFENAREVAMRDPEINLYANTAEGESAYMQAEAVSTEVLIENTFIDTFTAIR